MKDALATLKTASGSKSGFLYDLPWYVIIGATRYRQDYGAG